MGGSGVEFVAELRDGGVEAADSLDEFCGDARHHRVEPLDALVGGVEVLAGRQRARWRV